MLSRRIPLHISVFLLLTLVVSASACADDERSTLTVFAAASLADVLQPLGDQFAEEHGADVRFSFGGSTMLAQVIRRGAPVDVFISAGDGPMDHLESAQLLASGSRYDLLGNTLVLAVPAGGEAGIASPEDLLGEGVSRFATADPALAPAGVYSRQALEGMGLWDELRPKRLLGANVRTALMYVTSGTADAAIVYATDAEAAEGVRVVWRFPEGSHAPVLYPAAALVDADNPGGAASFLGFLRSEEALAAFRSHGFIIPAE